MADNASGGYPACEVTPTYIPYTQIVPAFIALSFIRWIIFVAGFGKTVSNTVIAQCSYIP